MKRVSKKQKLVLPRLSVIQKPSDYQLALKNQSCYTKPKLRKIKYSPITDPYKLRNQCVLLQSCVENRDYYQLEEQAKEKEVANFLKFNIDQNNIEQKSTYQLIGREAQLQYYDKYKKLEKITQKNEIENTPRNALTDLLQKSQSLQILPCCLGLIKPKGQSSVLNVGNYKLGDKYIQAMSAGLQQAKLIQTCNLSKNRITNQGAKEFINQLSQEIIKIDLSHNNISSVQQKLLNLIIQNDSRLEYLNLQNNKLGDKSIEILCRTASYSKHLKVLNVRKNMLTTLSGDSIGKLIQKTEVLQELYIGVNRIYNEGGQKILNSIANNSSIKVFDYSLNKLGDSKPSCSYALENCLRKNKSLIHVDFSSNNFSQQQSKIISEGLSTNKKIYGIHFRGNFGYIDSKGFLILKEKVDTTLHSIMDLQINSYEINFRRQQQTFQPQLFKNVCWICQGWHQQQFKFNAAIDNQDQKRHVYIHFDFEMFEPRLISVNEKTVKYSTMVPPRKYRYFFTYNKKQHLDPSSDIFSYQIPLHYKYQMYCQPTQFIVSKVNIKSSKPEKIVNSWDELLVTVQPRVIGLMTKRQKIQWTYKDSVWSKEWRLQDNELTRKCFQKDWKNSKICNLVKNQGQQDKIKQALYGYYRVIKEIYRHYSSWSPFGGINLLKLDVWAVSSSAFTQFCNFAKLISKQAPLKIIDLTFITTNSMSGVDWKGNQLVPERGLVRFQFMESLVRLSEEKYKKNGICDNLLDSINSLLKDHIQPIINNFVAEKWRLEKYFIEQNDTLIKRYRPIFTQVYKKNSKLKLKPGQKPFMCLAQFKSIVERIGVTSSGFIIERDIFISFNYSMMTQIDELQNERFMKMSEIEFIEAIARLANLLPNSCKIQSNIETIQLYHKFQWLIHQIKNNLCSQDLKTQFPNTQISIFTITEDDDC